MSFRLHQDEIDRRYMQEVLELARKSLAAEDVPVGALVVYQDRVIGRGFNQREKLQDPTAHAEMLALTAAAEYIGHWRLENVTLYCTLEPCTMCAGAMVLARPRESENCLRLARKAATELKSQCKQPLDLVQAILSGQRNGHSNLERSIWHWSFDDA